ncbi:MAG: hypothetical protein OZ928_20270 [Polyangiaceae bacterium]|nr:hypothetical protein [Polyangiaceae bacterium]
MASASFIARRTAAAFLGFPQTTDGPVSPMTDGCRCRRAETVLPVFEKAPCRGSSHRDGDPVGIFFAFDQAVAP